MHDQDNWRQSVRMETRDRHFSEAITGGTGPDDHAYLTTEGSADATDDPDNFSPACCDVCGTAIPPTQTHCSAHKQGRASSASTRRASPTYTTHIAGAAIALVEGSTKRHALAMANAALQHLESTTDNIDDTQLLHAHDDYEEIAASLPLFDRDVPELIPFETDAGTSLVEETLDAQDDAVRGDLPTIVDEMQTPITSQADLTAKQEGPTEQLWVIPAVCYRRERTLDGETVRPRPCPTCDEKTEHVHTSTDSHRADPEKRAYWTCLECGDGHRDVPPATGEYELHHYDDYDSENYPASDSEGKSEQRQLFETVIQHIERSECLSVAPE